MSDKYILVSKQLDVTAAAGNFDIELNDTVQLSGIFRLSTLAGGAAPTVDLELRALDEFDNETAVLDNMGAAVAATNVAVQVNINNVLPRRARLKWVTANGPSSAILDISIYGRR